MPSKREVKEILIVWCKEGKIAIKEKRVLSCKLKHAFQ